MRYLIDGYNFLFRLYEEIDPLRQKRDEVIAILQEKLQTLQCNMTIVFDSHMTQSNLFPSRFESNSLEIIYTPSGQTADAYILELLSWKKNCLHYVAVTSDKRLGKQIQALGGKVKSIEEFLHWILKQESHKLQYESKTEQQESPQDFKRLLDAFEKRLKDDHFS